MNRARLFLVTALIATLVATWWAASIEQDSEAPATASTSTRGERVAAGKRQSGRKLSIPPALRKHPSLPTLVQNPFAAVSFQPPPPKPVVLPPEPPKAPPLRFVYLGLLDEGGRLAVFLNDGTQLLVARPGEILAGQYRVDNISQRAMTVEYLPLGEKQILQFGRQ